jgi:retinol dehydrogenase-12
MAARSQDRAEAAIKELEEATAKKAIWLELDLADLASVRKAAASFLAIESALHLLFNNAGVMWAPLDMLTKDGYDLQCGTNVVVYLTFHPPLFPSSCYAGSLGAHARVAFRTGKRSHIFA